MSTCSHTQISNVPANTYRCKLEHKLGSQQKLCKVCEKFYQPTHGISLFIVHNECLFVLIPTVTNTPIAYT